jgi:hypothetical protein
MGILIGLVRAGRRRTGARLAVAATAVAATALLARVAAADHPGAFRGTEMSPLTMALLSAGLTLATALVVVIIVMLLTRRGDGTEQSDE